MSELRLGPFSALEPFGKGGMAEVWRGVHRAQDVPVAIKFVGHSEELSETWFEQFSGEVRAVAGLNHDSIVMVFDHGRVDAAAAAASGGAIQEGTPWLAMEFCSGQSLYHVRPKNFDELAEVLERILAALAYAHARGVLHRDLKPDNVMFSTDTDARPGLKLTDFGLAFELGDVVDDESRTVGTPHYMAPEQCYGNWRDYGPWTDLYAVGCLAWDLCTGRPPFFGHKRLVQLLTAHVRQALPDLRPSFEIPDAFEGWMRRLLEKLPSSRFQNAADAKESLLRIVHGELPRWQNPLTEEVELRESQTIMVDARPFDEPDTPSQFSDLPTAEFGVIEEAPREHPLAERVIPEMPIHWKASIPPQPEPRLVGAGLNLFGLRQVPMVDRFDERDLLWNALKRVRTTRHAQVVVLEGPAGTGKSRIAQWFAVRASELGVARVLQVGHDPNQAPGAALADLCAQMLRTQGLSGTDLSERVAKVLGRQRIEDPLERDALISLLGTEDLDLLSGSGSMTISFADPRERYAVFRRLLARAASERPVVLCLDDLQWGSDTLAFVEYLLSDQNHHNFPILMVLTHRQELLAENPLERSLLQQLIQSEACERRVVSELPPQYRTELVEEMLGLEPGLAAQVAERSGGNPLFAVQLVGDWVERRVLEVSEGGFRLAHGEQAELPDDIHSLWSQRLQSIAQNHPPLSLVSLELAAALGQDVDEDEWQAVCAEAGVPLGRALIDDLLGQDLMESRDGGWRFSHHLFRESIDRQAREQSRYAKAHWHCAKALAQMPRRRGMSYRVAHHFLAAEAFAEALEPFSEAAGELSQGGSIAEVKAVLADYDTALSALDLSNDDPRIAERLFAEVIMAQVAADSARLSELVGLLDREAWPHMKSTVLRLGSELSAAQGDWDRGLYLARQAVEASEGATRGQASGQLGMQLLARGELMAAQSALELALALSDAKLAGKHHMGLAMVAQQRGDLMAAESHYQKALDAYEQQGQLGGLGNAINGVAEIARLRGDLRRALDEYTRAMELYETTGRSTAVVAMNLALTLMNLERFEEAEDRLNRSIAELERLGSAGWLIYARALLLPCLAARQEWSTFDSVFTQAQDEVTKAGIVDGDLAWVFEKAGDLAHAGNQSKAAQGCYQFALSQWQQLKRVADVNRVERRLAQS